MKKPTDLPGTRFLGLPSAFDQGIASFIADFILSL